MAAIDFPASPANGQTFTAANGVQYQWNGTLWIAMAGSAGAISSDTPPANPAANQLWFNSLLGQTFIWYNDGNTTQWVPASPSMLVPTTPGGDFQATQNATHYFSGTLTQLPFNTVLLGNAGSWYNTTTGRYTPPAGRYLLYASVSPYNGGGTSGSTSIGFRKNGVMFGTSAYGTTVAGSAVNVGLQAEVDASGTDYFDVAGVTYASSGECSPSTSSFGAFPLSGIKGPPGDPGQLGFRLLQRTAVSAAVADVKIQNIPSDINDLKFHYDLTPVSNTNDLVMQFYDAAGVLDSNATRYNGSMVQTNHIQTGTAPGGYGQNMWANTAAIFLNPSADNVHVGNSTGIAGSGSVMNIRAATRQKIVTHSNTYVESTGSYIINIVGTAHRNVTVGANITGMRLVFGTGNIASGAFSVWGSP